jgi:hypothetical protein
MHRLISSLLFLTLIPQPSFARDSGDSWESLKQLRTGQKIQVVDMKLKTLNGTFVEVTEEAILLRTKEGESSIERANVFRVSDRERTNRRRNALIGAAILGGVGITLGSIVDAVCRNETNGGCYRAVGLGAIGAGAGAGLGAGLSSYQTIYQARKR